MQNLAGSRLMSLIEGSSFNEILDIGCGTGSYTGLLRENYPNANIKAVDISKGMIDMAKKKLHGKNIDFHVGDAETLKQNKKYDLISSNGALQWFEDLEDILFKYSKFLKKEGVIAFSLFGPRTFCELGSVLKDFFSKNTAISAYNFVSYNNIKKNLTRFFKNIKVTEETYKERHNSLKDFLKKIKYTGTRGYALNSFIWTPGIVCNLEKAYRKKFKEITATYQVFFCKGIK